MDFPFYGNAYSSPYYAQSLRKVPFKVQPKVTTPPPQVIKPKVVSIPVHFVGSEQSRPDSSHSAVKIQKVFRGFLVRKSVNKIKTIRKEVNDIERRVSSKETVDLIRNDSKERLKINETLMSLLFKLDSVRVVDSGVRNCRKSVIRKSIALQERVDAIVSGKLSPDANNVDSASVIETADQNQGINDSSNNFNQNPELQTHHQISNAAGFMPSLSETEVIHQNQETIESSKEMVGNQEDEVESMETIRMDSQTDSSANPENLAVEEEEESKKKEAALGEEEEETCLPDEEKEENINKEDSGENTRSKELLIKMMEDNEKMMGLMTELFEKNERQTRLLSALSQRVEHLEKAFLYEKLRRKKRRSAADCV